MRERRWATLFQLKYALRVCLGRSGLQARTVITCRVPQLRADYFTIFGGWYIGQLNSFRIASAAVSHYHRYRATTLPKPRSP